MKKEGIALLAVVLLIGASGCGNKTEQLVESTEVIAEPAENAVNQEKNAEDLQKEAPEAASEEEKEFSTSSNKEGMSGNDEVLNGSVKSINKDDNFVVINKIFTEELDGGEMIAVELNGVDSDEQELITVYFTEDTGFRIKTVINAGEEVTEKEGTFSDIKEESTLELKGKMDAKGEEFLASDVVIYEFVYS